MNAMTPVDPELLDMIALSLVPGLGPRLTQALLDHFGSASAARRATFAELQEVPLVGKKLAHSFVTALQTADPQAEVERAAQYTTRLIPINSPEYPPALKTLDDAPHLLYLRGDYLPSDGNAIGIVGSRKCSSYGIKTIGKIAAGLARAGYTVVSGLALGIDGAAHRGALEANGRTLAVLAGGLSNIYPPEHVTLADDVAKSGGLLTETPLMMEPQRGMFHARNRLISGLSQAVVIIEANERSGALITARHAVEQGRDVFVVPANVDSPFSAGSLRLLRDGAKLIRHVDDLLEDLQGLKVAPIAPPPQAKAEPAPIPVAPPPQLDPTQQRVWDFLSEPRNRDELVRTLGLAPGEAANVLLMMTMKKLIRQLPGNIYERR
jgi:DNA processing protein